MGLLSNKNWRQRGVGGEEEDRIRNRLRDASRNEDINHLKVRKPGGQGRGNVGVEFAGYP